MPVGRGKRRNPHSIKRFKIRRCRSTRNPVSKLILQAGEIGSITEDCPEPDCCHCVCDMTRWSIRLIFRCLPLPGAIDWDLVSGRECLGQSPACSWTCAQFLQLDRWYEPLRSSREVRDAWPISCSMMLRFEKSSSECTVRTPFFRILYRESRYWWTQSHRVGWVVKCRGRVVSRMFMSPFFGQSASRGLVMMITMEKLVQNVSQWWAGWLRNVSK